MHFSWVCHRNVRTSARTPSQMDAMKRVYGWLLVFGRQSFVRFVKYYKTGMHIKINVWHVIKFELVLAVWKAKLKKFSVDESILLTVSLLETDEYKNTNNSNGFQCNIFFCAVQCCELRECITTAHQQRQRQHQHQQHRKNANNGCPNQKFGSEFTHLIN